MGIKESTQEKLEAQIKLWSEKISKLKSEADKMESGAKKKLYETIEKIQREQQQAQAKLQALKANTTGAWEELKGGVEKSVEDLRSSVAKAFEKLKNKP